MKPIFLSIVATLFATTTLAQVSTSVQHGLTVHNDVFWDTTDGTPIYSQGGGIFLFDDPQTGGQAYYWYGAHYLEADRYRQDPSVTLSGNDIQGVTCYKSTDLANWKSMGYVLSQDEIKGGKPRAGWFGRLGVAYIDEIRQYALVAQHNNSVQISLSDSPTGPFRVQKHIDMKPMIGTPNTGDQTVFTDPDTGKDYLIYSYGQGRHRGYISEIGALEDGTVGLKNCVEVFRGESREGNCMFKYQGKYYLCASNIYGWDSSFAYYLVSDNIYGPYTPVNNMQVIDGAQRDYAHVTQTGFFFNVRGSEQETVIYCGDRWCNYAGNGLGYNQWFPMSFQGDKPYFNSLSAWTLDARTGRWSVHRDNNYILNGSFEADRKLMPSSTKPRQEQLMGWESVVVKGNAISLENPHTPHPNYINTHGDRQKVIGEKSLCLADSVDFERKVTQEVLSTPFVQLRDGMYILRLKFRDNALFDSLAVEITSAGKTQTLNLKALGSNDNWTEATARVPVAGGKAVVTFHAIGKAGAQCLVDDVELKQMRQRFMDFETKDPNAHDPVMARGEDGKYYCFMTGMNVGVMSSPDMVTWRMEPSALKETPQWAMEEVKGYRGHTWAPDISYHNGKWYLYYSCSTFGKNGSAIGLATNRTLDPKSPDFRWEDQGLVIASHRRVDNWNAIDPNLIVDRKGQPWLTYGSFWDGIQLVKLSKKDFRTPVTKPVTIARRVDRRISHQEMLDSTHFEIEGGNVIEAGENAIEAPFIFQHGGYYYLFVSFDYCCRGQASTYKTVYGRSRNIQGPYLDRKGKPMEYGGGTYLYGPDQTYFGVGHCSAYEWDGKCYFISHAYEKSKNGAAKLFIRPLEFDSEGWIVMSP